MSAITNSPKMGDIELRDLIALDIFTKLISLKNNEKCPLDDSVKTQCMELGKIAFSVADQFMMARNKYRIPMV